MVDLFHDARLDREALSLADVADLAADGDAVRAGGALSRLMAAARAGKLKLVAPQHAPAGSTSADWLTTTYGPNWARDREYPGGLMVTREAVREFFGESPLPGKLARWLAGEPAPAAVPVNGKDWTADRLAALAADRKKLGTKGAAERYGISAARVRALLPGDQPQPKGYSAFSHRPK